MATQASGGDIFTSLEGTLDRVLIFGGNVADRYLDFQQRKDQAGLSQALASYGTQTAQAQASAAQAQTITSALNQRTALYVVVGLAAVAGVALLLKK